MTDNIEPTKPCSSCKRELPFSAFYKLKKGNRLQSSCKECVKGKSLESYYRNPELTKERTRFGLRNNPAWRDKRKVQIAKRRIRKRDTRVEVVNHDEIWERDKGICHLCGLPVDKLNVHFDHVIPLSKGGTHTKDNIKVSHSWCNLKKGNKILPNKTA